MWVSTIVEVPLLSLELISNVSVISSINQSLATSYLLAFIEMNDSHDVEVVLLHLWDPSFGVKYSGNGIPPDFL